MTDLVGRTLSSYRITAALGAGGMGEVFRATDTKLGREVALKVLPAELAADPDRLARFEREARVLASLNHPGIAHLYGFESAGTTDPSSHGPGGLLGMTEGRPTHFLVMELVDGEDLAERLRRGPIPVDEALAIAKQIAEALEEAHEKGIVHRDLKPSNVKVTPDGNVKVLDFGLAKAWSGDAAGALSGTGGLSQSPTLARTGTEAGLILGTAAYMSPEQARGKAVDKRADIWAFGVVLYETLTGRKLFDGETVTDVLAAVVRQEIDWKALPATLPAELRRLLARCLERNPKQRLHDIADARIALEDAAAGTSADALAPPSRRGRGAWALGAGGLAAGLVLGWLAAGPLAPAGGGAGTASHAEFHVAAPEQTNLVAGIALSPDGERLAFVTRGDDGRTALWVRSLASTEARMLPGTVDARYPFWSPNGRKIGFFAQNRLKVTDLFGGQPRVLTETGSTRDVRGGAWGAGDVILFAPSFVGPLLSVPAGGGTVEPATRIAEASGIGTHRFPSFLPDGRRFLLYASSGTGTEPGSLWLGELGSLDPKLLGPTTSRGVFAPPGYVLHVTGDSLVAHRFDDRRGVLVGEPVPLGVSLPGTIAVSGLRSLAAAENGVVAYREDKRGVTRLLVVDRSGAEIETIAPASSTYHYAPRLSLDGRRMAVTRYEGGSTNGTIWLYDLERKAETRLTLGTADEMLAAWSPDGRELLYSSVGGEPGTGGIYRQSFDRPAEARRLLPSESFAAPEVYTPDGRRLVFTQTSPQGRNSLWVLSLDGQAKPRPLGREGASEWGADVSPDGRFLAYTSDASRRWEVYVRDLDAPGEPVRVSTDGGFAPRWQRDGRELFYVDDNRRLLAVPVLSAAPLRLGTPVALFDSRLEEATDRQYDVFPDGRRFLLNRSLAEEKEPISIVLGWTARLERGGRP